MSSALQSAKWLHLHVLPHKTMRGISTPKCTGLPPNYPPTLFSENSSSGRNVLSLRIQSICTGECGRETDSTALVWLMSCDCVVGSYSTVLFDTNYLLLLSISFHLFVVVKIKHQDHLMSLSIKQAIASCLTCPLEHELVSITTQTQRTTWCLSSHKAIFSRARADIPTRITIYIYFC